MRAIGLIGILAVCGAAATADAFVVREQFAYRVGAGADNTFTVVPTVGGVQQLRIGAGGDVQAGQTVRIRVRFGVFDDAGGAAPAGGFVGWNIGTIDLTNGQTATRTSGRIAPFNFAPAPPGNGVPAADPFSAITGIDNTLGTQSPSWVCDANGNAPAQPPATIRGLNTFVSTYEISTTVGSTEFDALFGGNLVAASGWGVIGTATPPDCGDPGDPSDDVAGSVTYAPQTVAPIPATWTLQVRLVPAPGSLALLGLGGLVAGRRRRA
jgi:hypothetical protein